MANYKRYFYQLEVKMPDGEIIRHRYSTHTFDEVIEKIGILQIKSLNLTYAGGPLVLARHLKKDHYPYMDTFCGDYVMGRPGTVKGKAALLNKIAEGLPINLKARVIREEKHSY